MINQQKWKAEAKARILSEIIKICFALSASTQSSSSSLSPVKKHFQQLCLRREEKKSNHQAEKISSFP
jgi:hypothetical protein